MAFLLSTPRIWVFERPKQEAGLPVRGSAAARTYRVPRTWSGVGRLEGGHPDADVSALSVGELDRALIMACRAQVEDWAVRREAPWSAAKPPRRGGHIGRPRRRAME